MPPSTAGPIIGLSVYQESASWGVWNDVSASLLPQSYVDQVVGVAAIPVLLPSYAGEPGQVREAARAVLRGLDAVIITGGPDVEPSRYGAEPHPATDRPGRQRDAWEAALTEVALDFHLPLLGICRGMQVLNTVRGGTLTQHLPDEFGDRHREVAGRYTLNVIELDPAVPPGQFFGPRVVARCHHHQAIEKVGAGLCVSGSAADGVIEAVWMPAREFAVGVQWHPEEGSRTELFQALAEAASRYAKCKGS